MEIKRPHILGLAHYGLYVHDLEKSRAFYKDFLGFDEPYTLFNKDGSVHLTWIKINDDQSIELFPEKTPGSDRLNNISIRVDDVEAMRRYLAAKGFKVPDKIRVGGSKSASFSVKDPDGHVLDIIQYLPDSWTTQDNGKHLPATRISDRMPHAGIAVRDLESAMKFYRDILGFREIWRASADGKMLTLVQMQVPDGTDFFEFLLYARKPNAEELRFLHHFCLEVPDVAKAKAVLAARKLPDGCQPPVERIGLNNKRQIYYFDPDGTRIELMETNTVDGRSVPSSKAPPPHPAHN